MMGERKTERRREKSNLFVKYVNENKSEGRIGF